MPEIVTDCPRCGSDKITFDVRGVNWIRTIDHWQHWYECFCVCRHCHKGTLFVIAKRSDRRNLPGDTEKEVMGYAGSLNDCFSIQGFVNLKDGAATPPPDHLPNKIDAAFREGAMCMAVACYNAAGTMFRLCLDFATKELMPEKEAEGLNGKVRGSLGLRMNWLFDTGRLPEPFRELAACVKDDGNDGAHEGTLSKVDAEDLQDFTFELLERLYTEPERLKIAKERRNQRHAQRDGN